MAEAITEEQAKQEFLQKEDEAIMAGADMEDISAIRTRAGFPAVEEIPVSPEAGFTEEPLGFAEEDEEYTTPSYQWNNKAAWEHVQKLQAAVGLSDEEKTSIYNDLVITGSSSKATDLWSQLDRENKLSKIDATASVVNEIGMDSAAQQVQNILSTEDEYAIDDAALSTVVANSTLPKETVLERWEKEDEIREQFKREYAEAVRHKPIKGDETIEAFEVALPYVHQSDVAQLGAMLAEKFGAPLDHEANAFVLEGNYLATIRDWIDELPAEEQLNVFRSVVDAADEDTGLFTDNDYLKRDLIRQLFSGATNDYIAGDIDTDKYINNAVSLLELTVIGSLVTGAVRAISGLRKMSSIRTVERIDEVQGTELAAASIIDDTGNTAEALGATREDVVVDSLMPKWRGYADDSLVRADLVERQIKLMKDIQNRSADLSVHMKDSEKAKQVADLENALKDVNPLIADMSNSTTRLTDEGIEIEAVYKVNDFRQAENTIKALHPEAVIDTVEDGMRVRISDKYRAGNNVIFDMEDVHGRGNKAKYLADVSANLAKSLSDSFYVAYDSSRGHEHLFLEMIEPFTKASNRNKGYVVDILDRTRSLRDEVSVTELRDMLPPGISNKDAQEIMEGVVSVRTMTDAAYVLENRVYRDRQLKLGRKYVRSGEFEALATPAKLEDAISMKVAYDPRTDKIVELDKETIQRLYTEGNQIAVSAHTHGASAGTQTRNILIQGNTTLDVMPQRVLKYDANYLTTLYKDQYFITSKRKNLILDGERLSSADIPTKVLSTAKSRKEALAAVERLRTENPNVEIDFKHSRDLTQAQNIEAYESLRRSTGGLFFSKKGERLTDVATGRLAEIEDPVTSIQTQAASVSRLVEMRPVVDLMKQRFINTFPQFSQKGFPTSKNGIVNPNKIRDENVETAKVLWDYINMVENGNVAAQKWQSSMVGMGEWLEDITGSAKLGSFVRTKVGMKDPLSAARGATFLATIALNPARQLLIQSQQYLFLAGLDPKYVLSGAANRRGTALLMSSIGDKAISEKALAKLSGMSTREFKQASQAFKESGLTEAIDSHLLGRDAMLSVQNEITRSKAGALGQIARNTVTKAIGAAKGVGFDLGERINISNTYMLAWKRYKDSHPNIDMTSKQAKFDIAADARQLALGMTRAGAFGYQEGILSAATQFFSIQHKAFLAMLRGVPGLSHFGNKAITPQEARRIMLFQTGIYGGAGMGINAVLDDGLEAAGVTDLSPTQRQMIHGGALDLVLNTLLSSIAEEPTDFAFSSNMSAGQGFAPNMLQYIEDMVSGDVSVLELMAGASANTFSRFGVAASTVGSILGAPRELDAERAKLLVNDLASITSGYRQYLNADSMTRLGQWVDKNRGVLPISATTTEAFVYGMFGISSREVETLYATFMDQKASKERLEGIAKTSYERINRIVGATAQKTDAGILQLRAMQEAIDKESYVLQAILGKDSADYHNVIAQVQTLIKQRVGKGEEDFVNNLHRALLNNTYGGDLPSLINHLGRNSNIDDEDLNTIREVFEKGIGTE